MEVIGTEWILDKMVIILVIMEPLGGTFMDYAKKIQVIILVIMEPLGGK